MFAGNRPVQEISWSDDDNKPHPGVTEAENIPIIALGRAKDALDALITRESFREGVMESDRREIELQKFMKWETLLFTCGNRTKNSINPSSEGYHSRVARNSVVFAQPAVIPVSSPEAYEGHKSFRRGLTLAWTGFSGTRYGMNV